MYDNRWLPRIVRMVPGNLSRGRNGTVTHTPAPAKLRLHAGSLARPIVRFMRPSVARLLSAHHFTAHKWVCTTGDLLTTIVDWLDGPIPPRRVRLIRRNTGSLPALDVTLIMTVTNSNQSLVVYRISTRACHSSGRARAGFDSPPGSFFLFFLRVTCYKLFH
jgi:hypothetical protein